MDVGLDIGGTKTLGMLLDGDRVVKTLPPIETGSRKGREFIKKQFSNYLTRLTTGYDVERVAYAISGPTNGTIVTACLNTPEFVDWDLRETLPSQLHDTHFAIWSDSTAFALGEYNNRHVSRMLGVIFGTGVSCCSVENGIPRCYERKGHVCTADVYADRTLEIKTVHEWLGKPGIESRYKSRFGTDATLEQIWAMRDSESGEFQDEIVQHAATYLSHVKKVFTPELIVIGGGQSGSPLIERLRESYPELHVVRSPDTSRSAILGAIALSELSAAPLAEYAVR